MLHLIVLIMMHFIKMRQLQHFKILKNNTGRSFDITTLKLLSIWLYREYLGP